jgi:hypothetical protein
MSATAAAEAQRSASRTVPARLGGRRRPSAGRRRRASARRRATHLLALSAVLAVALSLRLWGITHGLPYSYNSDEDLHFVPVAVGFFSGDFNPHYFLNPPAYSYLLHVVLELWLGSPGAALRAWTLHPGQVFLIGRVLSAVLGTGSVLFTYLAARRLLGAGAALAAAAVYGVAFLPVFYGHLALNDSPTLLGVSVALYAAAGVALRGSRGDYALAGVATGLAAATKYTGGIVIVSLIFAALADARRGVAGADAAGNDGAGADGVGADGACADAAAGRPRRAAAARAARRLAGSLALLVVGFVVGNPYSVLDFPGFIAGVSQQVSAAASADPLKLGITPGGGIAYYLWTFTWGFGLVPAVAALGGALLAIWRRRLTLVGLLVPAPLAFILFMGLQARYFGRWLMPIFPIVALLAAHGAASAVRWLVRSHRTPPVLAGALAAVLLVAQSVSADIHDDRVLSRPDTRTLTRRWMVAHIPAGSRVVVEPVVPSEWAYDLGVSEPYTASGARWRLYPTQISDVNNSGRLLPRGEHRYVPIDQYERTLRPALISAYEREGYCWVVVGSLQASRPFVQPRLAPEAIAYYRALARDATVAYHVSPYWAGAHPVAFSYDWTIDYYPDQYRLPGPEMWVYRLHGGLCATRGRGLSPGV